MKAPEKLQSLTRYIEEHKARLASPTPEKHKNHPEAYKAYLELEIKKAQRTIDRMRSEGKI
jgi:hypothetical protein